jgi:hypothetical protein
MTDLTDFIVSKQPKEKVTLQSKEEFYVNGVHDCSEEELKVWRKI